MKFSYSQKLGKYLISEHGIVIDSDEDSQALRQRHNCIEVEESDLEDDQQMQQNFGVNEPTQEYWETVILPILQPPDAETSSETVVAGIVYVKDEDGDPRKLAQAMADALLERGEGENCLPDGNNEDDLELIRSFLEGEA